jgi:hypothetical protein
MTRWCLILTATVLSAMGQTALGQAYCAIRDPVRRVYEMFPEADGFRTIVTTVGPAHREGLAKQLPFTLHFSEFGRHSLFIVLRDGLPLGLIHVRSERGRWGLIELCWALDMDLNVVGLEFQRCRDPKGDQLLQGDFGQSLIGADFESLLKRADQDATIDALPADEQQLAQTILRSGLKTIALTRQAWSGQLQEARAQQRAARAFGADSILKTRPIPDTTSAGVGFTLSFRQQWALTAPSGAPRGLLLLTGIQCNEYQDELWWVADAQGRLLAVESQHGWPDETTKALFESLQGRTVTDFGTCASVAELAAERVLDLMEDKGTP